MSVLLNPYSWAVVGGGGGDIPDDPGSNFWGNRIGVAAVADAYHPDGLITSSIGGASFDCGAYSIPCFDMASGGRLIWHAGSDYNKGMVVGLAKADPATNLSLIEFGLGRYGFSGSSWVNVWELGTSRTLGGYHPNPPGSVYEIHIEPSGRVSYWSSDTFIYESSVTASAGLYHACCSILDGELLQGCQLLALAAAGFWYKLSGVTLASDATHSDGKATKTYGTSWSNTIAYSGETFVRADAKRLVWTPSALSANTVVGIDNRTFDSVGNVGYTMPYCFIPDNPSGSVYPLRIWENTTQKFVSSCQVGDVMEIRVATDGAVTYWKNGTLIYTSLVTMAAATPHNVAIAILDNGAFIDNVDLIPI